MKNLFREFSNDKPQAIKSLNNNIIPEPFNLTYHMQAAQAHYHKRRRRMTTCNDRYLLFMLDTSGSIGKASFTHMVSNLSELVSLFCGNTKIAALTFGSHTYHEFCFRCSVNNEESISELKEAIKNIPYHSGMTHTGEAIKCACDNILTIPCGLPKRKKYRNCPAPIDVVVITDGYSNGPLDVCEEAKCLHNHNFYDISTYSIGVGNYNETELLCLENHDDDNEGHIFFDMDDFDELEKLLQTIIDFLLTPIDDPSSDEPTYRKCYDLNEPLRGNQTEPA